MVAVQAPMAVRTTRYSASRGVGEAPRGSGTQGGYWALVELYRTCWMQSGSWHCDFPYFPMRGKPNPVLIP